MTEKSDKFEDELNQLIAHGERLLISMRYSCNPEGVRKDIYSSLGEEKALKLLDNLPKFRSEYQGWYSVALALIKKIFPDRYADFQSYYEFPRVRKDIDFQNYMIRDYLQGLHITKGWDKEVVVDGSAAIPEFTQQLNLVKAAKDKLRSQLLDLKLILQADLFDSELESARALGKNGYLRAAGAVSGVLIEKHLHQVVASHSVPMRKKNPSISDLNEALKASDIITVPQWRFVQHLADIRNICDHAKGREPTKEEIADLLAGVEKVLKTVF